MEDKGTVTGNRALMWEFAHQVNPISSPKPSQTSIFKEWPTSSITIALLFDRVGYEHVVGVVVVVRNTVVDGVVDSLLELGSDANNQHHQRRQHNTAKATNVIR
jgi:hypothetical protein